MGTGITRRRRLVLVLLIVLLLLGIGSWLMLEREKIQPGMTRAEVESILGPPDGQMLAIGLTAVDNLVLVWKAKQVTVEFDESHRVREVKYAPSVFDSIRAKLGF